MDSNRKTDYFITNAEICSFYVVKLTFALNLPSRRQGRFRTGVALRVVLFCERFAATFSFVAPPFDNKLGRSRKKKVRAFAKKTLEKREDVVKFGTPNRFYRPSNVRNASTVKSSSSMIPGGAQKCKRRFKENSFFIDFETFFLPKPLAERGPSRS